MRYRSLDAIPAIVHPSRAGLRSWLEQQPARRRYEWRNPCECLVGLYLREACGIAEPDKAYPWDGYEDLIGPDYWNIAMQEPWTCGAALRRMKD